MCRKEPDSGKLIPELYIVILNYNSFEDTYACISSILKATYKNYKIILVDNNSSDDSGSKLMSTFSCIEYVLNDKNIGFSAGCNAGIRKAIALGADHILLLNNDTIIHPDMLSNILHHINPEIGIASGKIFYLNDKNRIWYDGGRINFNSIEGVPLKKSVGLITDEKVFPVEVSFISGCFMYISKRTIENIGYFDESLFAQYEDIDYCIRAIKKSVKMIYIPDAVIWHKVSASFGTGKTVIKYKPFTYYLKVRNKLILIRRYTKSFRTIIAVLLLLPKYMKYLLGFLLLLKINEFTFFIKGIKDGIFYSLDN